MKKILIAGCALLVINFANAQQKEGKVTYERTTQLQIRFAGMNDEMARNIPKSRTDRFELNFGNNQSLWKQAEQPNNDDDNTFGGNGMQIRMVVAGSDDVLYCNFDAAKKVESKEVFDKKFIVDDSIRSLKWKLTDETKTILNHPCRKATATQYNTRMMMNMDNGKMERKEVQDTSNIVAWFTSDIPVSAGPAEFQGQLPGLILEMDIHDGRQTYKAIDISEKADLASIKEPSGKKHYTPEEFKKEQDKMMEEMQKNNPGGNRQFR
ncbi:MAG TPA: GLPGLI family protein, partial [Chitinophagaceae bacterium]|nr:GLPGLI family protein [Chitinophagaceae bacterium]